MPQQPATSFADDLAKARAAFDADLAKAKAGAQSTPPPMPAPVRAAGGFLSGSGLNPLDLVSAVTQFLEHPIDTAVGIVSPLQRLGNVKEAYQKGGLTGAANEVAASIPLIGPAAEHASQRIASGDTAGGYGEVVGMVAAPFIGGALASGAKKLPSPFRNPNTAEVAALEAAQKAGVPVDAGTMSGNKALQTTVHLSDRTLAGGEVAKTAEAAQAKGLATMGEQLAAKRHPSAMTPLTAGESVTSALEDRIKQTRSEAGAAYDELRQREQASVRQVQTGTKPSPSGLIKDMPVTEPIGFPVDMKPVKSALKPVYDRLAKSMPIAQRQASSGFTALENIVHGPDVMAASQADSALSAIKAVAREASSPELRDVSQGLAARAVGELDTAVRDAVLRGGGPDALRLLDKGRALTRQKYLTADVLESLKAEPVKAFRQAVEPKDASISKLRELQNLAPAEIPKIGRAWMDDLLQDAEKQGFRNGQGMAAKWNNLGPETKEMLFGTQLSKELDQFFTAAKRLSENPNPSGSASGAGMYGQLAMIAGSPVAGTGLQITGAVLSKALRNPTTVRLLTGALTSPAGPKSVTGIALRQTLMRLAADENAKEK